MSNQIVSVQWGEDCLRLLDQTKLPNEIHYLNIDSIEDSWAAIKHLQVRGAPAIGMTAAYGLYLGLRHSQAASRAEFDKEVQEKADYLASSRPTAINLVWALERLKTKIAEHQELSISEVKQLLLDEARRIQTEDEEVCRKIGEHAITLFQDGMGILTHCNAGGLATARYGTATLLFTSPKRKAGI